MINGIGSYIPPLDFQNTPMIGSTQNGVFKMCVATFFEGRVEN